MDFKIQNATPLMNDYSSTIPGIYDNDYYDNIDYHKKNLIYLVAAGFLILGMIIHIINWDSHALRVIPLKTKDLLGLNSKQDQLRLAQICEDRLKYDCAVSALNRAAQQQTTAYEAIKIANLYRKLKNYADSVHFYNLALQLTSEEVATDAGLLSEIYYGLARSHEAQGQNETALKFYDLAITAKPEVIQISVTQSYIQLLNSLGRKETAIAVIEEARKRGGSEKLFAGFMVDAD